MVIAECFLRGSSTRCSSSATAVELLSEGVGRLAISDGSHRDTRLDSTPPQGSAPQTMDLLGQIQSKRSELRSLVGLCEVAVVAHRQSFGVFSTKLLKSTIKRSR